MRNFLICLALFLATAPADAALQPGEIAILAAKNSPDSVGLAKYYAQARQIPPNQICYVDLPEGEVLERSAWETKIRPEIRTWIRNNRLQGKLRCFVTVWGVPLKIGKQETADLVTRRRAEFLRLSRGKYVEQLQTLMHGVSMIGKPLSEQTPAPKSQASAGEPPVLKALAAAFSDAMREAEQRIQPILDEAAKQTASQRLLALSTDGAGLNLVRSSMENAIRAGNTNEQVNARFQLLSGRVAGLSESRNLLEGLDPSVMRDAQVLALVQRTDGIAGSIAWIDGQQKLMDDNESNASFDSELSLILRSNYSLLRWQTNFLHFRFDNSPLRRLNHTMMVCRIDGPSVKLARSLIDTAIRVEKEGLDGKVYLDSSGAGSLETAASQGSDADYDRSILFTAKFIEEHTSLEVVLDTENSLFAPGACPDAAIYCGRYSLAKYVDAFDWKPGAIGYHIASSEASTLRNPDSNVWCKKMLDDGVCATLGPVDEPYNVAFPRPNEFIPLVLGGNHTFVECVYRTQAFTSWMMTAIGDPLYNPFAGKKAVKNLPDNYKLLLEIQ